MPSLFVGAHATRWLPIVIGLVMVMPAAVTAEADDESSTEPTAVVTITDPHEPGTPLHVEGKVVDRTTGAPIEGAHVALYHADDDGRYQPFDPSDESTARLNADLISAADGSFAFRTIVPGEYPDQRPGNRHIHIDAAVADGYAERGFVILFEGNVRDEVRSWAAETGFGEVIELTEADTMLSGFVEIRLEPLPEASPAAELSSAADG